MEIKKAQENFDVTQCEVIAVLTDKADKPDFFAVPPQIREFFAKSAANANFTAAKGTMHIVPTDLGATKFVIAAGAGKPECKNRTDHVRLAAYNAVRHAAKMGCKSIVINIDGADTVLSRAAAEGAALASYRFVKYKTQNKDDKFHAPETVTFIGGCEKGIKEGTIIGESQIFAREISNEPGNSITPEDLADMASNLASDVGLECEIWNKDRIAEGKMGAFYAVGEGSSHPPCFIRLTYTPKCECKKHIVLIGKGITFDSGGLNIKPDEFMLTMKGDKSGASAVLGAIRAAALLEVGVKITVLIAAAENMPDGGAFRPDDILTARNGKTIEIISTDAEGRLTLADALCFASELKPDMIVDIATLTGACAVALGQWTAGIFSNDDDAAEKVLAASKASGEQMWQLPMFDEALRDSIKGPFGDLLNCGKRYGGAITAAMFLEEFVGENIPWVHIDMAGIDFTAEELSYYSKGATGWGVRSLTELLLAD